MEERLKKFSSSNTAPVAKGNCRRGNNNWARQYKRRLALIKSRHQSLELLRSKKAKGNVEKNMARVK